MSCNLCSGQCPECGEDFSALRAALAAAEARERVLRELLMRLREWDILDGTSDGPFWRRAIDKALDATGQEEKPALSALAVAIEQKQKPILTSDSPGAAKASWVTLCEELRRIDEGNGR